MGTIFAHEWKNDVIRHMHAFLISLNWHILNVPMCVKKLACVQKADVIITFSMVNVTKIKYIQQGYCTSYGGIDIYRNY